MASREALPASVGADLRTYHDKKMGLPDGDMQKLTSFVTDRIPKPSCPLQLASESAAAHCLQAAALPCQLSVSSKTNKPRAGLGSASSCQEPLAD
jgi:hypothetical protein